MLWSSKGLGNSRPTRNSRAKDAEAGPWRDEEAVEGGHNEGLAGSV